MGSSHWNIFLFPPYNYRIFLWDRKGLSSHHHYIYWIPQWMALVDELIHCGDIYKYLIIFILPPLKKTFLLSFLEIWKLSQMASHKYHGQKHFSLKNLSVRGQNPGISDSFLCQDVVSALRRFRKYSVVSLLFYKVVTVQVPWTSPQPPQRLSFTFTKYHIKIQC